MLRRNMGRQARNEPTNLPEGVFTLFPGFWPDHRASSFSSSCLHSVLGVHERQARSLFIKQFTPKRLADANVDPAAVHQTFGHTKEIEEGSYKYGLKNTINALQEDILGWR